MSNLYKFCILLIMLSFGNFTFCQSEEKEVMKPINSLFEGMLLADTNMIKNAFIDNPIMLTGFKTKEGKEVIKTDELSSLINAIASKEKDTPQWIEKLYNTSVKVDGNIAQVWTDYSFFVGENFNHCGVDAFQLIKVDDKWKIAHIMDTRRKLNCEAFK